MTLFQAAKPVPADEAYERAKTEYQNLLKDSGRNKLRHHWLNAASRLEKVAERYPKSPVAPDALTQATQAYKRLAALSGNKEDTASAERCASKLRSGWPKYKGSPTAAAPNPVAKPAAPPIAAARRAAVPANGRAPETTRRPQVTVPSKDKAEKAKVGAKDLREAKEALEDEESPIAVAIRAAIQKGQAKVNDESPADEKAEVEAGDDADRDEVSEGPTASVITSLQEKLRDVRVGQAEVPLAAKQRLKGAATRHNGSEPSLVEQLGLKYRRVVIDAGHGGHDTGAIGPSGVREKDVALAIALKLRDRLVTLGLDVVLTRDDDTFVHLEERASIANTAKGDLFISVHCNAAPRQELRGIETYTLNTSSNRYSIRLAARENAASRRGVNDLQYILADLATKANTDDSAVLADRVQRSMVRTLKAKHAGVRDLGTKEALFHVLLGAKMPAILVETSFLSNPAEEKLLASKAYQDDAAGAIAEAVKDFLDGRGTMARVDR
ncbi:MAG: N-acetylmuramoyl-L-alanine amidase [Myxococcaceae bacterium]|nr:N-acetylmuramoyl-L-alanine amidase [Myxococcaceae bacterium]